MLVWFVGMDARKTDVQDDDRTDVPAYLARSRVWRRLGGRPACLSRGSGMVSQAGALLPTQMLQITGLRRRLSQGPERRRAARAIHDPAKIIGTWR
jgi:hypothetical protein